MKQAAFEAQNASLWETYDRLCLSVNDKKTETSAKEAYQFPRLYRQICQHYAVAKERSYSASLIDQLHQRVLDGHQSLYKTKPALLWRMLMFLWVTFPLQLRRHWRFFWLATALFYVPAILMGLACYFDDEIIYTVMSESQVSNMEYMYDPDNEQIGRSADRQSDTDVMMLGHYIQNNISIDFRTYAMGILAGLGTVFILLFNGLVIGGVAGHLTQLGFTETFWPFVAGHGSFELTAIAVSGAAGLRLAQPLYSPGQYRRMDAFRIAGKDSIQLILGAGFMTFVAAFIEAFWSSSSIIPNMVKYVVGALLWLFVIWYLAFAGRGYELDSDDSLHETALIDHEENQDVPPVFTTGKSAKLVPPTSAHADANSAQSHVEADA